MTAQGTATLYHLPSAGTVPLYGANPAVATGWGTSTGLVRLPMIRKVVEAVATPMVDYSVTTAAAIGTYAVLQFISEPFNRPQNIASIPGGIQGVIRGQVVTGSGTGQVAYIIRLMREDRTYAGINIPGDPNTLTSITGALSTVQTRIVSIATPIVPNLVAQIGDRILYEVGINQTTASATTYALRVGNPGTADFALTNNLTTDLSPWLSLGLDVFYGQSMVPPRQYRPHPFQPGVAR